MAAGLVYRKLLYEEASQPVGELGPIETDEERGGAFLLSAISCNCGLELRGPGMNHNFHQTQKNDDVLPWLQISPHVVNLCIRALGENEMHVLNVHLSLILRVIVRSQE